LPLLWDLTVQGTDPSIETRLRRLYRMGRPLEGEDQPPGIVVLGDVTEYDKGITWKLDDVSLGAKSWRSDAPREMRSLRVTVSLSRLVEAVEVERLTVRRTRDQGGNRRQRSVRTRRGDTLRGIAVRELGSAAAWKDLRTWNPKVGKTDPDAPLRANLKLVIKG
jgi:hypothetical protein